MLLGGFFIFDRGFSLFFYWLVLCFALLCCRIAEWLFKGDFFLFLFLVYLSEELCD